MQHASELICVMSFLSIVMLVHVCLNLWASKGGRVALARESSHKRRRRINYVYYYCYNKRCAGWNPNQPALNHRHRWNTIEIEEIIKCRTKPRLFVTHNVQVPCIWPHKKPHSTSGLVFAFFILAVCRKFSIETVFMLCVDRGEVGGQVMRYIWHKAYYVGRYLAHAYSLTNMNLCVSNWLTPLRWLL